MTSKRYKHWLSEEDNKRCTHCKNNHGKIWPIYEETDVKTPLHPRCRCSVKPMQAIKAGSATISRKSGADWMLKYEGKLPERYITEEEAFSLGWKRGMEISKVAKGKALVKGRYHNANGHLPQEKGRLWYEADINYQSGKRNGQRIVWSNDGLIFVTYDHYATFYEIV